MVKSYSRSFLCLSAVALLALAGCTGTSTYGTGKSQEAQLIEDLTGIIPLGGGKDRPNIDYSARPTLVKPPADTGLSQPVDTANATDENFPVDPETRRAQLLAIASDVDERNGSLTSSTRVNTSAVALRPAPTTREKFDPDSDNDEAPGTFFQRLREGRQERLARLKENRGDVGAGPRRYLTQPPKEYRTPADTAPVGELGEREKDPFGKKRKTILDLDPRT